MRLKHLLVFLQEHFLIALGAIYFEENFDDDWSMRWVMSQHNEKFGEFVSTPGNLFANASNNGIKTTINGSFYALSTKFPEFTNANKTLVLQYSVKYEKDIDMKDLKGCVNAFVELFDCTLNLSDLHIKSPYLLKFGPDLCGNTKKLQVTLQQSGRTYPLSRYVTWTKDVYTHVYTLILKADNEMYEILIDGESVHKGSLEIDFSLPPKRIKDPTVFKPDYWDDRRFIDDPTDTKPEDWDQPEMIINPNLSDYILGIFQTKYRKIPNPKYKGKWKPRQIDNPEYMGIWIHPEVDNPDYSAVHQFPRVCGLGFNFWQSVSVTLFDNLLITDDISVAENRRKVVLNAELVERIRKAQQDHNETEVTRLTEILQRAEERRTYKDERVVKVERNISQERKAEVARKVNEERRTEEEVKAEEERKVKEQKRKAKTAAMAENDVNVTYFQRKKDELNKKLMIAIYIAATLAVLAILLGVLSIYYIYHYRAKYLLSRNEMNNFIQGSNHTSQQVCFGDNGVCVVEGSGKAENQPYNKRKYEVPPSSFKIDSSRRLGSGEFGTVCYGSIKRGNVKVDVAVKMMNEGSSTNSHVLKGLISEIKILSYVGEHPNVLKMEGAYTAKLRTGKLCVFLELCELGSLENYLRSYNLLQKRQLNRNCLPDFVLPRETLSMGRRHTVVTDGMFYDLHKWSFEIASAMEFLASKQIVHADLATRNVLLNANKCAKVSDFGLSRRLYNYTQYIKSEFEPLPWRYMAPESLRKMIFDEKTDVWAFGVTLWEMFTLGDEPYPGLSWDVNFCRSLENGLRLPEPKHCQGNTYDVMKQCWETCADDRPTFSELKAILKI